MKATTIQAIENLQAENILTPVELFQSFDVSIGDSQKVEGTRKWDKELYKRGVKNADKMLWDYRPVDSLGVNKDADEKLVMNTAEGKRARVEQLKEAYRLCEPSEVSPFDMGFGPESVE